MPRPFCLLLCLLLFPTTTTSSTTTLFRLPVYIEGSTEPLPDLIFTKGKRVTPTAREYVTNNANILRNLGELATFTEQLVTYLRKHIDDNSIVLPTPNIQPLLTFTPIASGSDSPLAYFPGHDPAVSVSDYLLEHPEIQVAAKMVDELNAELLNALLVQVQQYDSHRELFRVPVSMGSSTLSEVIIREGMPILLASTHFCVAHLGTLDSFAITVHACTETVVSLVEKLHEEIISSIKEEEGLLEDDDGDDG
jgi:hypothetical protein